MCGIIGYNGKRDAIPIVIDGLKNLEYRGYDSSGIAYFKDNTIKIIKEKGRIASLENILESDVTNICIGHTRWATHGKPSRENSHPHMVGDVVVVHNGIIENYATLKEKLIQEGYSFKSETDTEVACCLIDFLYQKNKNKLEVLKEIQDILKGSYALLILFKDDKETMYALREGSPLIVATSEIGNFVASDIPAILEYTRDYYLLDQGEIAVIKSNSLKFYKDDKEIEKELLTFKHDIKTAKKDGYSHYMLKEIHEQPKVIHDYLDYYLDNFDLIPDISKYEKIHIVACGSAYHAGLIGSFLIEKYGNMEVSCYVASEYRYKKNFINKNTLVILVSQSGETADTIACLRLAKELNATTLGIVNVVGSTIAREADKVIYINAGCEIAVATTKAYTLQVLTISLLAFKLGLTKYLINESEKEIILKDYLKLPNEISKILEIDYTSYAKKIYKRQDIFFIGRLIDYYISLEGSLKLKEISYLHSETYPAGELKHGTISLIENNTPVIAVITDNSIYEKTVSNIKEVKARGAYTLILKRTSLEIDKDSYDDLIEINDLSDLSSSILAIIPLQMLAFSVANLLGYDIDKPRNLAKSVTVE
ncbi:MAG: glutamine--fructose-6-phosphate transaminase (isomerizing) [Bacilli bacterium]|nr:glutamine--fructose-6-phosphate transaminase (isomerizing) [Bacilli bacterium]